MTEGGSNWEGMLSWWNVAPHPDRIAPTPPPRSHRRSAAYRYWGVVLNSDGTHSPAPDWLIEEEKQYDMNPDPVERVYEFAPFFYATKDTEGDEITEAIFQSLFDELQGYVKSIEVASELHKIQALAPLLHNVMSKNEHASVRAMAAEAVTNMVRNNPTSQQLVMEVNGLQPLLYNSFNDPDATSKTKALGAISALIRNNEPGITAFRLNDGYAKLRDALSTETESVMFQREALNLILYLLDENNICPEFVTEFDEFHRIMVSLASSDDAEVRKASLRVLLVQARYDRNWSVYYDQLKEVLQKHIERISAMAPEDRGAAMEERQLVDSLWNAFYNEPSSL